MPPSEITPHLDLPLMQPSQAQKHITHNEAISRLDAAVQLAVEDRTRNAPPALPTEGVRHIVAAAATGDWSGQEAAVALYQNGGWVFLIPAQGWRAYVRAETAEMVFEGGDWQVLQPDMNNLDGVGVGTAWDSTNRLAISSDASLLSHAGSGHQLKVNKSATADTASLLFQTGWSGRAEMGLAGNDGFAIKVSADGNSWTEALAFDPATGVASGAAVQQSATDTTAGRLMRADWGYAPGTVLGAVSETAGIPTGAVIERGSTADGEYVRFADGTQICTFIPFLGAVTAAGAGTWDDPYRTSPSYTWTFPAGFAFPPSVVGAGVPPSGVTAQRRRSFVSMGPSNNSSTYQISVCRVGSDATVDEFDVSLTAIGRWF